MVAIVGPGRMVLSSSSSSSDRQGVGRSVIRHRLGRIGSLWAWATTALKATVNVEKGVLCRSP